MGHSGTFGTYAASEYFLNVFVFFLIFAGIILDKMGIRFTGLLSASLMVIGASIPSSSASPTGSRPHPSARGSTVGGWHSPGAPRWRRWDS